MYKPGLLKAMIWQISNIVEGEGGEGGGNSALKCSVLIVIDVTVQLRQCGWRVWQRGWEGWECGMWMGGACGIVNGRCNIGGRGIVERRCASDGYDSAVDTAGGEL